MRKFTVYFKSLNEFMQLQPSVNHVFSQLSESLSLLSPDQYSSPSQALSGSTIGQHVRHIIEMFQCLEAGYHTGVVNYEKRKRDVAIETDKNLAISLLNQIRTEIDKSDKLLALEGTFHHHATDLMQLTSNYYRELLYSLDHAIHHMAVIKIALKDLKNFELPVNYGVAFSTVKHQNACAQ